MRLLPIAALALSVLAVTGCTRWSMNHHLNNAYSAYDRGNCEQVMLELSKVERASRARPYVWPEVSMMRGQCLERQKMFVDAAVGKHAQFAMQGSITEPRFCFGTCCTTETTQARSPRFRCDGRYLAATLQLTSRRCCPGLETRL